MFDIDDLFSSFGLYSKSYSLNVLRNKHGLMALETVKFEKLIEDDVHNYLLIIKLTLTESNEMSVYIQKSIN